MTNMIELAHAEKAFDEYLKDFDKNNGQIKLKIKHTQEVVTLSEFIASDLKLDKENIALAKLIALLHDIGRFEQSRTFGDFRDYKNMDHAEYGVEILFKDGFIRKFVEEKRYDNVISKSIRNHNKFAIEPGLKETELLHARIIRDSDKTDNFRVKATDTFENIFNSSEDALTNSVISQNIYADFMNHKSIVSEERTTDMDCWVSFIAFIFDYNFVSGLRYIKEHDYINILVDRVDYRDNDTRKKMENIRKCALAYIDGRLCLE